MEIILIFSTVAPILSVCRANLPRCFGCSARTNWPPSALRLAEEAIVQLNRLLGRIERLLAKHNQRREGRLYALTTVLVPLIKRKRV